MICIGGPYIYIYIYIHTVYICDIRWTDLPEHLHHHGCYSQKMDLPCMFFIESRNLRCGNRVPAWSNMIILVRVVQLSNPGSWTVFATNINVGGLHNIWQPIISLLGIIILGIQIHVNCHYILTVNKVFHTRSCRIHAFWLQDLMQYCTSIILVGGTITILKNTKINGKDDLYYVPNHQHAIKTRMAYLATLSHQNMGNLRIEESSSIKKHGFICIWRNLKLSAFSQKKTTTTIGWLDLRCLLANPFMFHRHQIRRPSMPPRWLVPPEFSAISFRDGCSQLRWSSYLVLWDSSLSWWLTYPSEKWWSSSVGIMTFSTEWKMIQMFQTTNQIKFLWLMGWSMYIDIINVGFT